MKHDNPFKNLGKPPLEAPKHIKQKVMDGVEAVNLLKEVSTLFTFNYASTLSSIFKKTNKTK